MRVVGGGAIEVAAKIAERIEQLCEKYRRHCVEEGRKEREAVRSVKRA